MKFGELRSIVEPYIIREVGNGGTSYPDIGVRVLSSSNDLALESLDVGTIRIVASQMVRDRILDISDSGTLSIPPFGRKNAARA